MKQVLGMAIVPGALLAGSLAVSGCDRARGVETESTLLSRPFIQAADSITAGRYIVEIGGCNDCHTDGYMDVNGDMPESEWLTGSSVGFRGPWGTSYPQNLRLFVQETPIDVFVGLAKDRHERPPMPWPSLNKMSERDVRAVYAFIKYLGPKGSKRPEGEDPGVEPNTPYVDFTPHHLERLQTMEVATDSTAAAAI